MDSTSGTPQNGCQQLYVGASYRVSALDCLTIQSHYRSTLRKHPKTQAFILLLAEICLANQPTSFVEIPLLPMELLLCFESSRRCPPPPPHARRHLLASVHSQNPTLASPEQRKHLRQKKPLNPKPSKPYTGTVRDL